MATTTASAGTTSSGGVRLHVQRFGTFLSNMVLPNIGAFIAWGLITALFIETGWITLIGGGLGYEGGYGFVEDLGAWGAGAEGTGIVGPMITYLLPLLIGYTGGRMMYDDNLRGGVVGAIATIGAITGADVPMFLGAMVMGPLGGWSMKRLDALWSHKIRPGFEMLVNNFSAGIWGGFLAVIGFVIAGPFVQAFSTGASKVIDLLVESNLLPLTSVFIEPAKVLFLNNAVNQGILTPLGTQEAAGDAGQSILFLLEANPGPGLGLLLAFTFFGKGAAKASAPGAIIIQFVGGIHEIYFPYVLAKPRLILAVIAGGMAGITTNLVFGSGLRSPASPGSIIAVWAAAPPSSLLGVTASVVAAAGVSFLVAASLLKLDRSEDDGDLSAATAAMEARKGKKSSVAGSLAGAGRSGTISSIVFACDAGMGSSAMGASVLRKKVQAAGFGDVTVVNKAISNLTDTVDLVVTHEDLTDRARQRTPSATHVSVENFMNSPRYDEIIELLQQTNAGDREPAMAGASAPPAAVGGGSGDGAGGLLPVEAIVLDGRGSSRDEAITQAGELLVASGAVDQAYADAMHEREQSVSTYMGNLLALPHGTNEAKSAIHRTALSFVRYPGGIEWKGKEVKFVVGIAGAGNDHLALLGKIAEVFLDAEQVARLEAATTAQEVQEILGSVSVG